MNIIIYDFKVSGPICFLKNIHYACLVHFFVHLFFLFIFAVCMIIVRFLISMSIVDRLHQILNGSAGEWGGCVGVWNGGRGVKGGVVVGYTILDCCLAIFLAEYIKKNPKPTIVSIFAECIKTLNKTFCANLPSF